MTIKIASWNIEGRLSQAPTKTRSSPGQIIRSIRSINADIIFLPEAHSETMIDKLELKFHEIIEMGYKIYNVPYEDNIKLSTNNDSKNMSLMLLTKLSVESFDIIRLGNCRNAASITIKTSNGLIKIFGVHLDDISEATRINQIIDLAKLVNQSNTPTVVMGDFNAMHGKDLYPARFLRTRFIKKLSKFVWPDVFVRVVEMAKGEAIKTLQENTDLFDIDYRHRPTTTPKMRGHEWLPSIRLIQIDHIFVSQGIKTKNFVISPDNGSDHRAISAEISLKLDC